MYKLIQIIYYFLCSIFLSFISIGFFNFIVNIKNQNFLQSIQTSISSEIKEILFPIENYNNFLVTFGNNYQENNYESFINKKIYLSNKNQKFFQNFCGIESSNVSLFLENSLFQPLKDKKVVFKGIINFLKKYGFAIKKKKFSFLDSHKNPLFKYKINALIFDIINLPEDKIYILHLRNNSITCYDFTYKRSKFVFYKNIGMDAVNAICYYLSKNLYILNNSERNLIGNLFEEEFYNFEDFFGKFNFVKFTPKKVNLKKENFSDQLEKKSRNDDNSDFSDLSEKIQRERI